MPRAKENFETQIFNYFRDRPLNEAKLVFEVIRAIVKKREKTVQVFKAVEKRTNDIA